MAGCVAECVSGKGNRCTTCHSTKHILHWLLGAGTIAGQAACEAGHAHSLATPPAVLARAGGTGGGGPGGQAGRWTGRRAGRRAGRQVGRWCSYLWSECTSGLLPMYRAPIICTQWERTALVVGRHPAAGCAATAALGSHPSTADCMALLHGLAA